MHVLLVGSQEYPMYAPAWARGLRELGIKVTVLDWTESLSRGVMGRLERRFLFGPGINRAKRKLLEVADDVRADVVLLYAVPVLDIATIKHLSRLGWVTGYHNDDPFGQYRSNPSLKAWRKLIPYFQSHHVFRSKNVGDYHRCGIELVKELHHFYLPWLHRPVVLKDSEKTCYDNDIVFVGHAELDSRMSYLDALVSNGLQVKVYGGTKYWQRYLPSKLKNVFGNIVPVYEDEYAKTIAGSKISLAFFSRANHDDYTTRVFEIPAMGGFLMCERTSVMQDLYKEDSEAVMFSSREELIEKCNWYLKNDDKRIEIANAGRARCISSGYDVVSRMKQWVDDIENWSHKTYEDQ